MPLKAAVVYNQPLFRPGNHFSEFKAEMGVLDEVRAVSSALEALGCEYSLFPLETPLSDAFDNLQFLEYDVVFNLFEGFEVMPETEIQFAASLEKHGIPFTGCPSMSLSLALDKAQAKAALIERGIPTPAYRLLDKNNLAYFDLDFPCIVKPCSDDASHGISEKSVVYNRTELEKQVSAISTRYNGEVLAEEYIEGREFNATVLGDEELIVPAVSEVDYRLPAGKPEILTFESKWEEESLYYRSTPMICPARINEEEKAVISDIAFKAFRAMGCRGYARVDFRQDREGKFLVLEVNPNPDITEGAGLSMQLAAGGISYHEFVKNQIDIALNCKSGFKNALNYS
jgi:D-alanine-D-alanine ligase